MRVKAKDGLKVPKESASRDYITADTVVTVPDTVYYRRRVAEGDLIVDEPNGDTGQSVSEVKKSAKGA